jgi:serine/threonine-protein kinase
MRNLATMPSVQAGQLVALPRPERRRGARFGDLEVVAPLATGGMGGVYGAKHVLTGERFAIKVLDPHLAKHPDVVARLHAEAAIAQRADHPGLVRIHAAEKTPDGVPYLVMEYLDGDTLADVSHLLEIRSILSVGAQIAAALTALHDAGVIHCDVKPDNVMLLRDHGRVKVLDFGVSRLIDEPHPDTVQIAGTPWCMAPEQWRGRPVAASDVYSLGCLLFDLVTGDAPFGGSLPELMIAHMDQRPARPSWMRHGVPPELDRAILRALAKDPAQRPTMAELACELAELADSYELRLAG